MKWEALLKSCPKLYTKQLTINDKALFLGNNTIRFEYP